MIKNPPFYAIIFSVGFLYFDLEMPKAIINLTELLTYTAIVLILMSLGIALTKLKVFSLTNSIVSSIGRVIIGPLIGFIIIFYFIFHILLKEVLEKNMIISSGIIIRNISKLGKKVKQAFQLLMLV